MQHCEKLIFARESLGVHRSAGSPGTGADGIAVSLLRADPLTSTGQRAGPDQLRGHVAQLCVGSL
jgi:hypothetical protein